jgi:hypothetical protein
MISNSYNLSEDWGWFIDIESLRPIYQIKTEFVKNNNKKLNYHLNRLDPIEEDEYDYYMNNKKEIDYEEEILKIKINETVKCKEDTNMITAYGSTTLITALLTCIVFFVL